MTPSNRHGHRLTSDAGVGRRVEAVAGGAAAHGSVVPRPAHAVLQRAVARIEYRAGVETHAAQAEPVTGTLAVTATLFLV